MSQNEKDLRARLEALVDRWMKANPAERMQIVSEKIKLEEQLENEPGPDSGEGRLTPI